jgi:hypothetical protein
LFNTHIFYDHLWKKKQIQFDLSFMYTTGYFWVKQTELLICKRIFRNFACEMYSTQIQTLRPTDNSSSAPGQISDYTPEIHCPDMASESLLQISWPVQWK